MSLEIFKNKEFEIRVIKNERDEVQFCLSDICKALELSSVTRVKEMIDREFDKKKRGGVSLIHAP